MTKPVVAEQPLDIEHRPTAYNREASQGGLKTYNMFYNELHPYLQPSDTWQAMILPVIVYITN